MEAIGPAYRCTSAATEKTVFFVLFLRRNPSDSTTDELLDVDNH